MQQLTRLGALQNPEINQTAAGGNIGKKTGSIETKRKEKGSVEGEIYVTEK